MRLALPSSTSRAYDAVRGVLDDVLAPPEPIVMPDLRTLTRTVSPELDVLFCRGTDVPAILSAGAADVGLTGYDMAVEHSLRTGAPLDIRPLGPIRTSFVTFESVQGRRVERIYTEYPSITRAWVAATKQFADAELIVTHGSSEGVISVDERSGGVLLVTSGRTARENGLDLTIPLMETDVCVVRPAGSDVESLGTLRLDALPALGLPAFATAW